MPKYQYQCTECGEALEVQQSFTDDTLTVCPHCQGRLRKVFNAVGVVFKGSGFYRNDSRDTSTSSETPKTPAKESAGTSKESAPAAKESTPAKAAAPAKAGGDSAA